MRLRQLRANDDHGSMSVELVLIAPAVALLLAVIVLGGRLTITSSAVDEAARSAARTASSARTGAQAQTAARTHALASLADQGLNCTPATVSVNVRGFSVPVGRPASVTTTVSCRIRLSDLGLRGTPGMKTLQATYTSPLDTYRSR